MRKAGCCRRNRSRRTNVIQFCAIPLQSVTLLAATPRLHHARQSRFSRKARYHRPPITRQPGQERRGEEGTAVKL